MRDLIEHCEFDTVYHEHFCYFSLHLGRAPRAPPRAPPQRRRVLPRPPRRHPAVAHRQARTTRDGASPPTSRPGAGRRARRPSTTTPASGAGRGAQADLLDAAAGAAGRRGLDRRLRRRRQGQHAAQLRGHRHRPGRLRRRPQRPQAGPAHARRPPADPRTRRRCSTSSPTTCCCSPGTSRTRSCASRPSTGRAAVASSSRSRTPEVLYERSTRPVPPAADADRRHLPPRRQSVPTNSCLLLDHREEAAGYPAATSTCGSAAPAASSRNTAFDAGLIRVLAALRGDAGLLGPLPGFAAELASSGSRSTTWTGRTVLEIGCGKGEFLVAMCRGGRRARHRHRSRCRIPSAVERQRPTGIEWITDFYSEALLAPGRRRRRLPPHARAHPARAATSCGPSGAAIGDRTDTVVLFELPDVRRVLEEVAFWDVYYEHCSYFSAGSLARLFRSHRLRRPRPRASTTTTSTSWSRHGRRTTPALRRDPLRPRGRPRRSSSRRPSTSADGYRDHDRAPGRPSSRPCGPAEAGRSSGGPAPRASPTCRRSAAIHAIEFAVDINPHKHGMFMAGTGQEIVAPEFLTTYRPELVVVMNPIYVDEIRAHLDRLGLTPRLVAVSARRRRREPPRHLCRPDGRGRRAEAGPRAAPAPGPRHRGRADDRAEPPPARRSRPLRRPRGRARRWWRPHRRVHRGDRTPAHRGAVLVRHAPGRAFSRSRAHPPARHRPAARPQRRGSHARPRRGAVDPCPRRGAPARGVDPPRPEGPRWSADVAGGSGARRRLGSRPARTERPCGATWPSPRACSSCSGPSCSNPSPCSTRRCRSTASRASANAAPRSAHRSASPPDAPVLICVSRLVPGKGQGPPHRGARSAPSTAPRHRAPARGRWPAPGGARGQGPRPRRGRRRALPR